LLHAFEICIRGHSRLVKTSEFDIIYMTSYQSAIVSIALSSLSSLIYSRQCNRLKCNILTAVQNLKKKWNRKANSKLAMTFIYDKEEILQYYNSVV